MKQKTAIDWLEEALAENLKEIITKCNNELMESLFKQAKEKEREQIEEAYDEGYLQAQLFPKQEYETASDYYQQKYGDEGK